ncbi:MAG: cytochrome c biogenesis CcdA family protein [Candidatus Promineifilaceae bacterium]|nr:cytochrome c biogenesis CcdA family protein [Candidatus Promineifilaceae bacterium]
MSDLKAPSAARTWSVGRMILIGLAILLIGFLVLGTFTQSGGSAPPGFGIQNQPFLVLAVLAFVGGLLSFLSPCTLPILPAYFAFAFQSGRRQIAINTVVFMMGLASMFALLGASASVLGRLLLQNQQLLLLFGGSLVLVFGVMSLLGRGFTGMSQTTDAAVDNRSLWGSFIFGLTFAVGWSSCVGPILGAVLTLAAQTASVGNGAMLLFIYALGLGLPLIIVSTFFGRASRDSMLWRVMRGKGWDVNVHMVLVGLIWALAIWRILVAAAEYAFRNFDFLAVQQFTTFHEYGLLLLTLAGATLWVFTLPGDHRTTLHMHSTQAISGVLFILLGLLLLSSRLATFNSLVPPELAIWFADFEDQFILFFNRS